VHGDLAAARETCRRILHTFPDAAAALHLLGVMAIRGGDHRAGQDLLRRAAESPDATALYLLSYAELCCKLTDPAAALEITRRALALDANLPLGWYSLGTQLLDTREYAESKSCFERALQLEPGFWQARARISVVLARLGNGAAAFESFAQLLREQPDSAEVMAHYAAFLQELGHYSDALTQAERAIRGAPDSLDHHLRAADIEMQLGRNVSALERLRAIEDRWPDEVQLLAFEATLLRLVDRFEESEALCRDALARGIESADLLRAYGLALHLAGKDEEALRILDRATAARPAVALSEKAVLLTHLGRLSEACTTFDRALSHEPTLADAWYNKTNAKTYTAGDADIVAMQRLLEGGCSYRDEVLLHFALGKAHMDSENADAAFVHWHRGNRMKRASIEYSADAASRHLASIAARPLRFSAEERITGARLSELPVFVVGMPRSGSSLVEQILASHPEVHGGGERTRLRTLFETAARLPDSAAAHDDERSAETVLEFLGRLSARATRIVDKDLGNFLHLGVIHRILPRARIIHCRRNPLDTCFSAYTKLFLGDFPFTYDLRETGLYYRSYHALMAHWRSVLPARIFMEVDYETLVSEPLEARRLVHFLGLPWSEACARFFETRRTVHTASASQVRRPIYRTSIDRGARVIAHLTPLTEALGDLFSPIRVRSPER
jgi:tetratricopeptide (TPR) repeat protein